MNRIFLSNRDKRLLIFDTRCYNGLVKVEAAAAKQNSSQNNNSEIRNDSLKMPPNYPLAKEAMDWIHGSLGGSGTGI